MANELNIALPTSGLAVTAQRYQSGTAVGSAISLTEVGSSGFYTGNMTGSAGTYQIAFRSASANVGSGSMTWDGTAEVIDSSQITAIKAKTDALPASPAATGDIPTESEIAAEVWAKPTTELTITGSIGERAKNQSTVSTTGAQLAAALS